MTVCIETRKNYEADKENLTVFKGVDCYRVQNERTGRSYFVAKKDNTVTCTCPDWLYRKSKKNEACKHQVAVVEAAANEARLPELPEKKYKYGLTSEKIKQYIERW